MDTSTKKKQTERVPLFSEGLNQYYKLKSKYEKTIQKEVDKISTLKISNKEKSEKFKSFNKKCINCGALGGTIFKQEGTFLIAKCGSKDNPCNLDIKIDRGLNVDINNELHNLSRDIIKEKKKTVNLKLDYLFNLKDRENTSEMYETLKKELTTTISELKKLDEKHNMIVNNNSKNRAITDKENQLLNYIRELKNLITNYEDTSEVNYIDNALEIYNTMIKPIAKEIQNLKYEINYVYFDDRDGVYYLVQDKFKPSNLETLKNGTENKIITFTK